MQYLRKLLMIVGAVMIAAVFVNASINTETEVNKDLGNPEKGSGYRVEAFPIPENISFAGESVPLKDPDVRERLDREILVNTYWQSNAILLMKRANKYFPIIEPILKKNGVPDDFKYLAVIESGLTNAVSPAGASGFWQILKGTATDFGLEVNENVDERYHLEKATEVACKYLKSARNKFGSWTMAAASYNAGMAGMDRQLNRQKVSSYYDVLLGEETGRYVFRILALKEIMETPEKYGFHLEQEDYYAPVPVRKLEVDTAVTNFADFAGKMGINYKILKIHNPWLREAHLNNKTRKKYQIAIPEKGIYPVSAR